MRLTDQKRREARGRHVAARGVVAACVLCFCAARLYYHGVAAAAGEARQGQSQWRSVRLDARCATWRQLTLIPGIGESVARRIEPRLAAIDTLQDLLEVHGVGPATVALLARHLRLPLARAPARDHDPVLADPSQDAPIPRSDPEHR